MEKLCTVKVGERTVWYEVGTTYKKIAEDFQREYKHRIVLVFAEGYRLQELTKKLEKDSELKFITTADKIGHSAYVRSMCFLLVKAVHDVGGHENTERVRIHFQSAKGIIVP